MLILILLLVYITQEQTTVAMNLFKCIIGRKPAFEPTRNKFGKILPLLFCLKF